MIKITAAIENHLLNTFRKCAFRDRGADTTSRIDIAAGVTTQILLGGGRRHQRLPVELPVLWQVPGALQDNSGILRDIGRGGAFVKTEHPLPANGDVFEALLCRWPQIGALVVRASVRQSVGYLDETLLTAEDWDWLLRLSLKHRIGHVAVPGLMFRARPVATAYEDETNLRRVGTDRRVFWRYVWRGRRRILSPLRVLRAALR